MRLHLDTIYGPLIVEDPLAIELISSDPFQRLKEVNQYGVVTFIMPIENYSRYDHSLGVYFLLKKANCPRNEQIAGLLHDVSHTVFSHVGDYVFKERYPGSSYQDDIHLWYLQESGLSKILKQHSFEVESIDHKNPAFEALDRPLPELCADRIEYNLQGGFLRNLISKEDFHQIEQSLHFSEGNWALQCLESAKKLGRCSLIMTETLWGSAWEGLAYSLTAEALQRSFSLSLITFNEFHFSTDQLVWNKLSNSNDPYIETRIEKIKNIHSSYTLTDFGKEDLLLKLKFRGIDPLVSTKKGLVPLTKIDELYRKEFEGVKKKMDQGWAIKFAY